MLPKINKIGWCFT